MPRSHPRSLGALLIPHHVEGLCHPRALWTQVVPLSPLKQWDTLAMPQQSPFLQGAPNASSPASNSAQLLAAPHPRLTSPSTSLFPQVCSPRIIFVAGAAGGNAGCLQQKKRNRIGLAPFSSSLASDKSCDHQRRPPTQPLKSRHNWEHTFSWQCCGCRVPLTCSSWELCSAGRATCA